MVYKRHRYCTRFIIRQQQSIEDNNQNLSKMNTNTIIFFSFALLLLCVSSSFGMNVLNKDDDHFEVTHQTANGFLHSTHDDNSSVFDKRESGKNCVPCKFGVNPCCAPNVCVKKTLLPDECQEIKTGK